ncbi:hypothetical protein RND81_14G149000 [Saponaria officinalis]|uniref:Uncharacterized protein n=1 Tax=Saponaria officinalis TaxID=3572 RepID=A0AAW1GU50_SAPOF
MDLSIPRDTNDALFIQLESQHSPSCIHIRRQIPKNELIKLLPESWITNYEKIHEINTPLQSLDSKITKQKDGTIEIVFKKEPNKKSSPPMFFTEINTIIPLSIPMKQNESYLNIPIYSFNSLGDPVYVFKDESGNKFFDVCDCENCIMKDSDKDAYPRKRDRNKKSSQQILKEKYVSGDPNVGLLGEPRGKTFEYYVQYSRPEKLADSQKDIPTCYMFCPSPSQDINFPPTKFEEDNSKHSWKIKNPVIKNPNGSIKHVSAAEATLNWQSENARVQNNLLQRIDMKVTIMDLAVKEVHKKIFSLHQELLKLATTASIASPLLLQKESELKSLKSQLYSLQNPSKTPQNVPCDIFTSYPVYTPPFEKHPQPLPILPPESSLFGASSFLSTKILEERHIIKKRQSTSKDGGKASTITQIEPPITQNQENASQFMLEYHNPISSFLTSLAIPKTNKLVSQCSANEILMPEFMMAEPTHGWNPKIQDAPNHGFSFDNIPPSKWRDKIYEMHAWFTEQLLYPGTQLTTVIDRLVSRFYGGLRQLWISRGTYRQLQICQASTVDAFIRNINNEFLGAWDHYTTQAREEFLSMKCCSFMRKDLERNYERMSKQFYALGGMDDVNLKQAYLNSLPKPLGNKTARQFFLKSIPLGTAIFGELYQTSLAALEKLCNHQKFFKQLQE